jgi:hypothetical protein
MCELVRKMIYRLDNRDRESLIELIDEAIDYCESVENPRNFIYWIRKKIKKRLTKSKKNLIANKEKTFITLLKYTDYLNRAILRYKVHLIVRGIIRPIANLNGRIYEIVRKVPLILESNEIFERHIDGIIDISDMDRDFLIRMAEDSARRKGVELAGYGRIEHENGDIILTIDKRRIFKGTPTHCIFPLVRYIKRRYNFYWHTHCINVPFSKEDKDFSSSTGIPGMLVTNKIKISLLANKNEFLID